MNPFFILRKNEQQVKHWSGGQTTQLCIYPFDALYEARNFELRISTATVETDHSVFTNLTGYQRTLMVLDGHLKISHPHLNIEDVELAPYEFYSFDGEWDTESYGQARDFNVMTSNKFRHQIEFKQLNAGDELTISSEFNSTFIAFYIIDGTLSFSSNSNEELLQANYFICLDLRNNDRFEFKALALCSFVFVSLVEVIN
jgi:environmental stress-induced protein Ves